MYTKKIDPGEALAIAFASPGRGGWGDKNFRIVDSSMSLAGKKIYEVSFAFILACRYIFISYRFAADGVACRQQSLPSHKIYLF